MVQGEIHAEERGAPPVPGEIRVEAQDAIPRHVVPL